MKKELHVWVHILVERKYQLRWVYQGFDENLFFSAQGVDVDYKGLFLLSNVEVPLMNSYMNYPSMFLVILLVLVRVRYYIKK
jgi:hypothetical protein